MPQKWLELPEDVNTHREEVEKMDTYECLSCGYNYIPEQGDIDSGVEPETPFEDVPDDWVCPECGAKKETFAIIAVTCDALTKKFKEATILNNITLKVREATVFGLLGPDGSGKTTLIKVLTGLITPTSGSCALYHHNVTKDPVQALRNVGCVVGEPSFYPHMTAKENLQLFSHLVKSKSESESTIDIDELLESAGITFGDILTKHLSLGMKKQLGVVLALLGNPRLLLLDEPLTGDRHTRTHIQSLLQSEVKKKTTIFFTTYSPADIKELAAQGAVLEKGEITAQGPVDTLPLDQFMGVKK